MKSDQNQRKSKLSERYVHLRNLPGCKEENKSTSAEQPVCFSRTFLEEQNQEFELDIDALSQIKIGAAYDNVAAEMGIPPVPVSGVWRRKNILPDEKQPPCSANFEHHKPSRERSLSLQMNVNKKEKNFQKVEGPYQCCLESVSTKRTTPQGKAQVNNIFRLDAKEINSATFWGQWRRERKEPKDEKSMLEVPRGRQNSLYPTQRNPGNYEHLTAIDKKTLAFAIEEVQKFASNVRVLRSILEKRYTRYEWTALHLAAKFDDVEAIRFFAGHGMDVDALDAESWTPLILATFFGSAKAVHVLLNDLQANGTIASTKDCPPFPAGTTALQMARMQNYPAIVDLLRCTETRC